MNEGWGCWVRDHEKVREGRLGYLDVNPIELVKAHPRTPLRKPPEELPHHLIVDLIRAVEHHAQDANSLRFESKRSMAGDQGNKDDKVGRRKRGGTERMGCVTTKTTGRERQRRKESAGEPDLEGRWRSRAKGSD